MKKIKFYLVDVFAENKHEGNQLAVCIPDGSIEKDEMQKIAREINFSETTFIMSEKEENGGYDVEIFTPDSEIPFAGHPTIGTAHIIRNFLSDKNSSEVMLNLQVGQIPVSFKDQYAWMQQNPPIFSTQLDVETAAGILQINSEDVNTRYPIEIVSTGLPSIIIPLNSLEAVRRCRVEHHLYNEVLKEYGNANILVFTTETVHSENDLHARVFMFTSGHLEDPATGSANGNLAGYIVENQFFQNHKVSYKVEQGYEIGRPSLLKIEAEKVNNHFSIAVGGQIFVVAKGHWI
ncbi:MULTISPECIES: PhzF family phenazine biosynthesis protein [Bacillus]|uniref:PhzF family phenazine biosynthesis protein n=1 Tax=Bacillus TaxID=1386 RepID=UPI00031AECCE|nr:MULTISPECIES: PhzF family phenazine biosynthesis protein [Bacillus]